MITTTWDGKSIKFTIYAERYSNKQALSISKSAILTYCLVNDKTVFVKLKQSTFFCFISIIQL